MALGLREGRAYREREIVIERPDGTRMTAWAHADVLQDADDTAVGAVNLLFTAAQRPGAARRERGTAAGA